MATNRSSSANSVGRPATTSKAATRKAPTTGKTAAKRKAATTSKTAATRKPTANRSGTRVTAHTGKPTRASTSSTQPKTSVEQVQEIAGRVVLVPVGASLLAREQVVETVKELTSRYGTRAGLECELRRCERRGTTARNRLEREVRKTRTRFERELRQRRSGVQRAIGRNSRRVQREVRAVGNDLEQQSEAVAARVGTLTSEAQQRLASIA